MILAYRSRDEDPAGDRRDRERDRQRRPSSSSSTSPTSRRCARRPKQILAKNIPIHGLINNAGPRRSARHDQGRLRAHVRHEPPRPLPVHAPAARSDQADRARGSSTSRASRTTTRRRSTGTCCASRRRPRPGCASTRCRSSSNVLFTKELARRLEGSGVTTYAVHPGVVATDVWRKVPAPVRWVMKKFMVTPEQGAQSSLRTRDRSRARERDRPLLRRRRQGETPLAPRRRRRAREPAVDNDLPSGPGLPA